MALITWTDEYSVQIDSIDEQHQHLVEIVNKFEEANQRGRGSRIMAEILNDLMGYTQEHFSFEEKMLEEAGFANLHQHQCQHRQLIQKLERFQFEFCEQGHRVTKEMREFLKYWLTSHILGEDKTYVSCFTEGASESTEEPKEEVKAEV